MRLKESLPGQPYDVRKIVNVSSVVAVTITNGQCIKRNLL